jgi:hypothetical protein
MIFLAVVLALAGVFVGHAVLAQGPDSAPSERTEGSGGETGQVRDLTPEKLQALQAQDLNTIYHFAGALNDNAGSGGKATVVQCTNVDDTESTAIEVQLFEYDASAVYTGTVDVAPMRTATFESRQVPFYVADVFMNAGVVEQGYGRILAEHDNVICTVQTVDPDNSPPTWSFDLPLYVGPFSQAMLPAMMKDATP